MSVTKETACKSCRKLHLRIVGLLLTSLLAWSFVPAQIAHAEASSAEAVVRLLQPELNAYWGRVVRNQGFSYKAPGLIWYNTPQMPGEYLSLYCGWIPVENSAYCPETNTIFLDHSLARWAFRQYGDYAVGFMLAHEHAHAVQTITGVTRRYYRGFISERRYELQADCYAGVFTKYLKSRGILETGDLDEGADMASWSGDDGSSHGTAFDRMLTYHAGYASGDPESCQP